MSDDKVHEINCVRTIKICAQLCLKSYMWIGSEDTFRET